MGLMSLLSNYSASSLYRLLAYKILETKYHAHTHPKVYDWNWHEKKYNRIALTNLLIAKTKGWHTRYLEIGCASNTLFDSVAAKNKVGVDPVYGGTHRMTSDEFFSSNRSQFDVIFIDGFHAYQQVRKDAISALNCIADGGWIAFHDFLPASWKEHHVPRLQGVWTGDCWKLAVELSRAEGVDFKIVKIDYGVGLLKKRSVDYTIPDLSKELIHAEFDRFDEEVELLPIVEIDEAISFINSVD